MASTEVPEPGTNWARLALLSPLAGFSCAVAVLFWLIIAKPVAGCYTAICKGF